MFTTLFSRTYLLLLLLACFTQAAFADEAFEADLSERTFRFFWETADPNTGLIPDHYPDTKFASVAAVGFGLTAYPVGIDRGYITREQGATRTLKTLRFLWNAPSGDSPTGMTSYKGFFYHFLVPETGERFKTTELSTIDTALLMAGVLFSKEYYDGETSAEKEIRELADKLYRRVDWAWAQDEKTRLMGHGWRPEKGMIPYQYHGYCEAMILNLLAVGSPTHPATPDVWEAFCKEYKWGSFMGYEQVNFSPLFGHQYSHLWVDFRDIQDPYMKERGIDYFENSRRATLSQKAYGKAREFPKNIWGLTACAGPGGGSKAFKSYWARGASLEHIRDDSTITPTAAGGSIPFAPAECLESLQEMKKRYGASVYREYGFIDSFNPYFPSQIKPGSGDIIDGVWFHNRYLGIDQGPILGMLANYQDDFVWKYMRKEPYLKSALKKVGFTGGWLE